MVYYNITVIEATVKYYVKQEAVIIIFTKQPIPKYFNVNGECI